MLLRSAASQHVDVLTTAASLLAVVPMLANRPAVALTTAAILAVARNDTVVCSPAARPVRLPVIAASPHAVAKPAAVVTTVAAAMVAVTTAAATPVAAVPTTAAAMAAVVTAANLRILTQPAPVLPRFRLLRLPIRMLGLPNLAKWSALASSAKNESSRFPL